MNINDFFTTLQFTSQIIFCLSAFIFLLYVCYLVVNDWINSVKNLYVTRWIKKRCKMPKYSESLTSGKEYYSVDFYPISFSNKVSIFDEIGKKLSKENFSLTSVTLDKYEIKKILEDLEMAQELHYSTIVKAPDGQYVRLFFKNEKLLKEFLDKNTQYN